MRQYVFGENNNAIHEGRGAARAVDAFLMGTSTLPAPGITQGLLAGI
jgi:hypothetical protein